MFYKQYKKYCVNINDNSVCDTVEMYVLQSEIILLFAERVVYSKRTLL